MAKGDLRGTLTGSVNSVTNPTVASGSVAVSVGDLVFGTMSQQTNLTAAGTVTDNLGNTYAYLNAGTDAGTVAIRSFYARVTNAGTLTTINVPATASTNDASVVADVIEGPFLTSPLDANPANATDATTPFTCPATGTLAQADEVVMAAIALAANQTVAATSPSSLTGTVARANASVGQSRRVVSATTTVTPEFTGTSATAAQTTASFKLDPTQALTPSLFTNSETFFSPTITPGSVALTPSLLSDDDTLHAPTVGTTYGLTAALFDDGDTFFSPTMEAAGGEDQSLTPSLVSDGDSFFSATVASTYGLAAELHSDDDSFFGPTVAAGAVDLAPSLFSDADTFFAATATPGAVDLAPALYTDADVFHSPAVAGDAVNLQPSLVENAASFHIPTATAFYQMSASLFADADEFAAATVAAGPVGLLPQLFEDADSFYSATVSQPGEQDLLAGLFIAGGIFFAASVSAVEPPQIGTNELRNRVWRIRDLTAGHPRARDIRNRVIRVRSL